MLSQMVTIATASNAQLGSCSHAMLVPSILLRIPFSFRIMNVKIADAGAEATAMGSENITSCNRPPLPRETLTRERNIAITRVPVPIISANKKVLLMIFPNKVPLTTRI